MISVPDPQAHPTMPTPSDIIGLIAPESIRSILIPGPTIVTAYNQDDLPDWAGAE